MIERKNNLFGECSGIMIIIFIIVIITEGGTQQYQHRSPAEVTT